MRRDYRLLNVEGRWAGARLDGLAVGSDGALTLPAAAAGSAGLVVGSFAAPASFPRVTRWGVVRADVDGADGGVLPAGLGHVQLLTCATDPAADPPPLPPLGQAPGVDEDDAPVGQWRAAPAGVTTVLALCAPSRRLWVGGWLGAESSASESSASPRVRQVRVEAADDAWLELLPALYRRDAASRRFLSRLLALVRARLVAVGAGFDDLPRLLDPSSAPDTGPQPTGLELLAGWVGVELAGAEPDDPAGGVRRRRLVASAVPAGAVRGTADGLRQAALEATGVPVRVEEPGTWCSVWGLGTARLGVTTMLKVADPEGTRLGSAATLGATQLVDATAYGAPALAPLAGRVTVATTAAELGRRRDRLADVVETEHAAYTQTHLCVVQPRMRVGAQARLGIDTVVPAAPGPPPGPGVPSSDPNQGGTT